MRSGEKGPLSNDHTAKETPKDDRSDGRDGQEAFHPKSKMWMVRSPYSRKIMPLLLCLWARRGLRLVSRSVCVRWSFPESSFHDVFSQHRSSDIFRSLLGSGAHISSMEAKLALHHPWSLTMLGGGLWRHGILEVSEGLEVQAFDPSQTLFPLNGKFYLTSLSFCVRRWVQHTNQTLFMVIFTSNKNLTPFLHIVDNVVV